MAVKSGIIYCCLLLFICKSCLFILSLCVFPHLTRASLIRSYNNNTLPAPSLAHQNSKSSESDLSGGSRLLPQPEVGSAPAPPGAPSAQRPIVPPTELPPCGFNGCPASNPPRPAPGNLGSPGAGTGGELVPVALGRSEGGGMGFSVTAGGQGGQLALIKRVWDRRQCPSLQPGDAIIKINGADVQSLSFAQVTWATCSINHMFNKTVHQHTNAFIYHTEVEKCIYILFVCLTHPTTRLKNSTDFI